MVHTDEVISVSSEQVGAISGPGQAGAVGHKGVLAHRGNIDLELVNQALGLQIPDLDALGGGGAQPVSVGGEHEGVDDVTSLKNVQALALGQVPKHGGTVLATGSAQRAIGGDGHGVQVASVALEVGAESAVGQRPDLDQLVPAGRHDDGGSLGRGEAHAGDPLGVALVLDGELAVAEGVPQLDGAVTGSRDDLSVVGAEGDGQDILGVIHEAAGAAATVDLPQTEGTVPGAGQGVLAIGGDHDVGDEVVVASEGATGIAVVALLAGKGPHKDGFVSGGRQDHGGVLGGSGDSRDPAAVAGQNTSQTQLLSHF